MIHVMLRLRRCLLLLSIGLLLSACTPFVSPTPSVSLRPTSGASIASSAATMRPPESTSAPQAMIREVAVTSTPSPQSPISPVLRINIDTYPDTLDPHKSSLLEWLFINEKFATLRLIYEGLTRLNENLETVPGAAESWTYNAAATEVTFKLRPHLKYSDGTVLNAKRFEYSLLRNINPDTRGDYGAITDDILGAYEWRTFWCEGERCPETEAKAEAIVRASVQALDSKGAPCTDYEQADCLNLKIKLAKPVPYFHTIMSMQVAYPAKEENVEAGGEIWWDSSVYQIGNGPFALKVVEPQVRQYFVPNENYWGNRPQVDVEFRYIDDPELALQMYRNNEFDIITPGRAYVESINADANLKAEYQFYPSSCTTILQYNLSPEYLADGQFNKSPFHDKKVREAFAYAFDAEGWVKEVGNGLAIPAWTWIPPGQPGYDEEAIQWQFDPMKARQALAESSYQGPDGLNKLGLKFTFYEDKLHDRERFEWLVKNYKKHLNVNIALDPTTHHAMIKDPQYWPLLTFQSWCTEYPDPFAWFEDLWVTNGWFAQIQAYSNEKIDRLLAQANVETDPAKRLELYKQAQRLLIQDVPAIFAHHTANRYLVKPWVKGIVQTPEDGAWPGSIVPASIRIERSSQ